MFISHKFKVIFIHIQKAGGSSIQQLFKQLDPDLVTSISIDPAKNRPRHCFATDIEETIGSDIFRSYTKFCVVRNPFDRLVSWYWMLKLRSYKIEKVGVDIELDNIFALMLDELNTNARDFDEFVSLPRLHKSGMFERFFVNQLDYISDESGIIVDRVLRFETLGQDFAEVVEDFGLQGQLPHTNKTQREADYRSYYNETTRQLIAKRFQKDLDYFNYKF